jgi:uncharacterized membrane protein YeaQ/YmgE (transglycosylase-associated protein family)
MNLLSWIIFGVIVGIVANSLEDHGKSSLRGAVLLGIGGAVLGGFLATLLFGISIKGFDLTSFLVAAGGSLFVLSLGQAVRNSNT